MDPDIALFVAVVDAGSLSAAARVRGISPAMVSKRIARLEARLGVRLLHRTTRRLDPTPAGARFHADMAAILAAIAQAEARLTGDTRHPSGPLRVSAPTSYGRMRIAPRLKPFLDAYPGIALELNLSDGFDDLAGGGIDLAVRITARIPDSLVAHRLASSHRILCAAPAYLAAHGVPMEIDALAGHRLLAASGQMPWRLTAPGGERLVEGTSHVRTNSSEVVRELALAGVGIALRSHWDVADTLADGRLVRVLDTVEGAGDVGIYAVHPRGGQTPAVAALIAHLRATLAEQTGTG
jgi:DNA-binding transcriptional LysR family regulator